jgi:putative membrane protein
MIAAALALLHPLTPLGLGFTVHPSTVIGIAALAALYVWRARKGPAGGPSAGQRAAFASGLAVLFLTLNGPLHDLSDSYLFTAHMAQHLVLTMLVTPLLIAGTPDWMLRPALRIPGVFAIAKRITTAPAAFAIFNITLVVWHLPPLYNLAMANHDVHIGQHLCFLVASTIMWWPLMSTMPELPRLSYPKQMLYAIALSLPMSVVAIVLTYAETTLYPAYAAAPRIWGITPLQDQSYGGLLMWIPGGMIFFGVASVRFFQWAASEERTDSQRSTVNSQPL